MFYRLCACVQSGAVRAGSIRVSLANWPMRFRESGFPGGISNSVPTGLAIST